jgi:hypothetical protein
MKFLFSLLGVLFLLQVKSFSQSETKEPIKQKKQFYFMWGYHRDMYSASDIHFKDLTTNNYDFTLRHAIANDKPDWDNFFTTPLTVPQYSFSVGYFKNEKWGYELSWDHLKYVVNDDQVLHLVGQIEGKYHDTDTLVTPSFVHFQHTNGNNYAMVSALRRINLFKSVDGRQRLSLLVRAGAGALVPKTYSTVLGQDNSHRFHLAGFVVGTGVALRYDFLHYFFIEQSAKGAFADYTSAVLKDDGRATHTFFSVEYLLSLGINIPRGKIKF